MDQEGTDQMEGGRQPAGRRTRAASTVILVREDRGKLQLYLLRRSKGAGFFPGSYVFPGGALEEEDRKHAFWMEHIDLSNDFLIRIFGREMGSPEILAYGVAAVRETFEEAGVFLAHQEKDTGASYERLCSERSSGKLGKGWLERKVVDEGWTLSFSSLFPWAHWITPEAMTKRFDTRFFLALMPEGQECIPDEKETVEGIWVSPEDGLRLNMAGEVPLSPPTLITLHELLPYGSLEALKAELESRSWGPARLPVFKKWENGAIIIEPWDPMYGNEIRIDPEDLEGKVLPPGTPFSRIWLKDGIWKPIGV
ncbi:MAG: hypothetical protein JRH13_07535 [Deltaproteobacteria bacterium]|nr:hypothetical protein [Deltaproteobacteria bacterium]MBW2015813.1 hypothetical protein [Deltaproteobacteria bacterium]MBW2129202.1 hypothetical protein [Deltaproteobacteria bacterium]MBW2303377.1 hypothetical protein [Deltaproteobacteria bacterium]